MIFSASDRRGTVLIGLRAVPQTSASFARSIRNALRNFGVSTSGLRGHWLVLISEREAIAVILASAERPVEERVRTSGRQTPMTATTVDDSDAKVVELFRGNIGNTRPPSCVPRSSEVALGSTRSTPTLR